jgi:hypothetical protein
VVANDAGGELDAFILGADDGVHHLHQTYAGGPWGTWAGLLTDPLTVAADGDGRLELVALSPAGYPLQNAQTAKNSPRWTSWSNLPFDPPAPVWNGG